MNCIANLVEVEFIPITRWAFPRKLVLRNLLSVCFQTTQTPSLAVLASKCASEFVL